MKNEFMIALKNLIHNPGRTILTLSIIMVSLGALLFVDGYVTMIKEGFAERLIRSEYGHFQIYPEGYLENDDPTDASILFSAEEFRELDDLLFSMDTVDAVLPRLPLMGMVGNSSQSMITIGIAGDPVVENLMARGKIEQGGQLDPLNPSSAVIGKLMAESLEVGLGDLLTMTMPNSGGGIEAAILEVTGIAAYGPEQLNRSFMQTTLDAGQQLHYTDGVQSMVVLLNDTADTGSAMNEFRQLAGESGLRVEMKEWRDLAEFYTKVIRDYGRQIRVMLIVVLILGTLAVSNTIHISVIQRIPEIGTLRAMGITNSEIVSTILFEGLFLGVLGGVLGVLLALGIQGILNVFTIMLPPPPGTYEGVRLSIMLTWRSMTLFAGLFCLVTLPAALPPAFRGIRTNIIETLRS